MADLLKIIGQDSNPIVSAIYAAHKTKGDTEPQRAYLGASIIGHECDRYLWYNFRGCCHENIEGRMYRLLETGDLEEIRFINDLRSIGCEVYDRDDTTGEQFAISDFGGHFSGHLDGCGKGIPSAEQTWHVLEFKTHKASSFVKLLKDGVQKTKPMHYAQMQVYMHKTGMTRALYLAKNKDTDELYAERVHYDKEFAERLMEKARRIIFTNVVPERAFNRADYYQCRWCSAHDLCWGTTDLALPIYQKNCRQCCHATPKEDGVARWECEKHHRSLSKEDQIATCKDHICLPGLFCGCEPIDSGDTFIDFQNSESIQIWRHGEGGFSTDELMKLPKEMLLSEMITREKEAFGMVITASSKDDIVSRYPAADSRQIWKGPVSLLKEAWSSAFGEDVTQLKPINQVVELDFCATEYHSPGYEDRIVVLFAPSVRTGNEECEIRMGVA